MTAVATLTGALSDRMTVWRLQARMVKVMPDSRHDRVPQGALARLELLEGKLSRAVLRGLGGGNPARLPGGDSAIISLPNHLSVTPSQQRCQLGERIFLSYIACGFAVVIARGGIGADGT